MGKKRGKKGFEEKKGQTEEEEGKGRRWGLRIRPGDAGLVKKRGSPKNERARGRFLSPRGSPPPKYWWREGIWGVFRGYSRSGRGAWCSAAPGSPSPCAPLRPAWGAGGTKGSPLFLGKRGFRAARPKKQRREHPKSCIFGCRAWKRHRTAPKGDVHVGLVSPRALFLSPKRFGGSRGV